MVPNNETFPCLSCSCPFVFDSAFFALSASSAKLKSVLPRIGPAPGIVMMSMNIAPLMPPWFCAANWSMRGRRIDRIWDLGGSLPPVNPSTRIVAPGGAIALSTRSISSGSSGSASICSRVSTVLNAEPRGSIAALCLSRLTVTASSSFWSGRVIVRRLSPARTRTSRTSAVWKPGNSARTVYRPGSRSSNTATPNPDVWPSRRTDAIAWSCPSRTTAALGRMPVV